MIQAGLYTVYRSILALSCMAHQINNIFPDIIVDPCPTLLVTVCSHIHPSQSPKQVTSWWLSTTVIIYNWPVCMTGWSYYLMIYWRLTSLIITSQWWISSTQVSSSPSPICTHGSGVIYLHIYDIISHIGLPIYVQRGTVWYVPPTTVHI